MDLDCVVQFSVNVARCDTSQLYSGSSGHCAQVAAYLSVTTLCSRIDLLL